MAVSDFPVEDEDRNPYPSIKGAMVQAIRSMTEYDFDSWYHFERIDSPEEDTAYFNVISFNEQGDEDKVYILKMTLEADNDDLR